MGGCCIKGEGYLYGLGGTTVLAVEAPGDGVSGEVVSLDVHG